MINDWKDHPGFAGESDLESCDFGMSALVPRTLVQSFTTSPTLRVPTGAVAQAVNVRATQGAGATASQVAAANTAWQKSQPQASQAVPFSDGGSSDGPSAGPSAGPSDSEDDGDVGPNEQIEEETDVDESNVGTDLRYRRY